MMSSEKDLDGRKAVRSSVEWLSDQARRYVRQVLADDGLWTQTTTALSAPNAVAASVRVKYVEDVMDWLRICVCRGKIGKCARILEAYQVYYKEKVQPRIDQKADAYFDGAQSLVRRSSLQEVPCMTEADRGYAEYCHTKKIIFELPILPDKHGVSTSNSYIPNPEAFVNMRCKKYSFSLLHTAVIAGQVDIVKLLLKWHASVSATALHALCTKRPQNASSPHFYQCECVTPLWLAAAFRRDLIVSCLLSAGASVDEVALWATHPFGLMISPWKAAIGDLRTCHALFAGGKHPAPLIALWRAIKHGWTELADFLRTSGAVRWDRACCRERELYQDFASDVRARELFQLPCLSAKEEVCKAVFCQSLLHYVVLSCSQSQSEMTVVIPLVHDLLLNGASVVGWCRQKGHDLCDVWNLINDGNTRFSKQYQGDASVGGCMKLQGSPGPPRTVCRAVAQDLICSHVRRSPGAKRISSGKTWVTYCPDHDSRLFHVRAVPSPSPILVLFSRRNSAEDQLCKMLAEQGALPGIPSLAAIPMAAGVLHDSVYCKHNFITLTAAQQRVPLEAILFPQLVPSLRELCCARILSQLDGDTVQARRTLDVVHFRWIYNCSQRRSNPYAQAKSTS